MDALIGAASVIAIGALTPGPNNIVVMRAAATGGMAGALGAIVGVTLGSLALYALALTGVAAIVAAQPRLQTVITLGGCVYLVWLGVQLIAHRRDVEESGADGRLPNGTVGLFFFQFLNPKSWVLVLTATSAAQARGETALLVLAALFVVIPAAGLALWAGLGARLTHFLRQPSARAACDGWMGALLIASALLLGIKT